MKGTLLAISILCLGATDLPAASDANLAETTANRKLHELQRELSLLLKKQATAKLAAANADAIQELVSLYLAMSRDERLETSPTLDRLHARLRVRLRGIQRDLQAAVGDKAASTSNPSVFKGARGGRAQRANNAAALIELIQATIAPDVWDVNGGESSIRYFAPRHALVVRAPSEVHGSVRGLLGNLRQP